MAVPKQKKSKAKVRSRRANHDKITLPNVAICTNCGADVLSHRACPECGYYKGRQAVSMKIATVEDFDEAAEV